MYSESWMRVANMRVHLRPSLEIRRQHYRGERWFVLHDPFANKFFRFRPEAYGFIARLSRDRSVDEVWKECLKLDPDNTPGQDEAIQILSQLYQNNLIQSEVSPDSAKLFERYKKQQQRQVRAQAMSILFIRIPLWDPQRFLARTWPLVAWLFSKVGLILWLLTVGLALKIVAENWQVLADSSQEVIAPANLPLLFVTFFVIKLFHEMGHAYAVHKFGGEVHTMGIMLLVFSPIPYVDATSAWAFRERWKRVFVGAAGMIVEILIAAIAAFVWINTDDDFVSRLAYNVMFIASVTTVLFNANPLLRFDGYYILSDLTDTPNLSGRGQQMVTYWAEKFAFGVKRPFNPSANTGEAAWLSAFCCTSFVYRIYIFAVIILFVADKFFGLGLIAAIIGLTTLFIVPVVKFISYLAKSPKLAQTRSRAVGVSVAFCSLVLAFLAFVPFPNFFREPGVIMAVEHQYVTAGANGFVTGILVPSNTRVEAGTPLIQMRNEELDYQIQAAQANRDQLEVLITRALNSAEAVVEIKGIRRRIDAVEQQIAELNRQREALTILAPISGLWVSPGYEEFRGVYISRGESLGQVVNDAAFEFRVVVEQANATYFFEEQVTAVEMRFSGQAEDRLAGQGMRIVPSQQETLPSASLGWFAGGPVETRQDDEQGMRVVEPYFLLVCDLPEGSVIPYYHNRVGTARFVLPWQPLLIQWIRDFRQLLQSRFQI